MGQEKFVDIKWVIRRHRSEKYRQYNGHKKKGKHDLQNISQNKLHIDIDTLCKTFDFHLLACLRLLYRLY